MAKIAAILTDWFEDVEYTKPVSAFREAGHTVVTVGLVAKDDVIGKKEWTKVTVDVSFSDVTPDEFDALLIPGGYSPDKLRAHEGPVAFVRAFMEAGKPVFSICHAPQILITAKTLEGRHVTGYKSIVQDIINAGARYEDKEVIVDGNLVTSRQPSDLPAFIWESLKLLDS
ncbi:MAG: type 1 glutamine amidotransferase [Deltaproteobacteria bacterium]|nr:type 1 glutamine amidotransferase [Candidatus Zymogenaceae bacterium]